MKNNESHISSSRKNQAQHLITAKISVLEKYLAEGVPENAFVPKSETQFRLWEDAFLDLKKIGSPNTLNKPYNKQFKQRITHLIGELATRRNRKERKMHLVDDLRGKVKEKDQLIGDLAGQWHSVKHQLEQSKNKERRLQARVEELNAEVARLTEQIRKVVPLKNINNKMV